ncbi:CidA-associated membrane protein CidB [Salmonella bongori]|nr:CidA-associated membrane protein CidB [Salmonella bongori]
MTNFQLSILCLAITLVIYFANKRLYRRFRKLPLMPLVLTPALLVLMLLAGHISWQNYIGESHWLLWLLGPATIAFAVPVYDNLAIIKRHWMSLTAGVVTATVVAVTSSVWLARLFTLSDEIQRSLAVRSVTTRLRWRPQNHWAVSPIWLRCSWSSRGCSVWQSAMRYFYGCLYVKAWRKEPDSARRHMERVRRGHMNWVNRKVWLPAW